jgi:triphosphoribosyl-dephospho-CoA synthase
VAAADDVATWRERIAAAFRSACADELAALKPGNVHAYAEGHRMTVADFRRSADVAALPLTAAGGGLGRRIRDAVVATRAAVGQNTNLGILLLCAPLAAAAEQPAAARDLRAALRATLADADPEDAREVFAAIALAAPGGLGEAPAHDVRAPARVTLAVAMAAAAERDSIARAWTDGFAAIFETGLPVLRKAAAAGLARSWATTRVHLTFMARWPDSHILRKHGPALAASVRVEAEAALARLRAASSPEAAVPALIAWDADLKSRGINPGTSADLTVATLFADRLEAILRQRSDNG